jgi:hypothetical protein
MTDAELLKETKARMNITGTYHDTTLSSYINDAKEYMIDSGVSEALIDSKSSVGVIVRGVSDLWNYGMGNADFSPYFRERVIQLRYKDIPQTLNELTVSSIGGAEIGSTHISVSGQSPNAVFKYSVKPQQMNLPEVLEDVSDWYDWDGVSDIIAEDGHYICISEVNSENKVLKAGITKIVVNWG